MTEAVAQYTPGPWHIALPGGPQGPFYGLVNSAGNVVATQIVGEANARFITGAPAMADALLWIRENLHPKALGRGATDAELYAITHATFALRAAGVIPTPGVHP